jgi:P2-related tail formation protein
MKQAISNYFLLGRYVTDKKQLGPLFKLLQAIGYVTFDINDQVERLQQLLSIKDCPDNLLPYLADIIGWKLYGYNVSSWRRQLWNAVDLYNAKGSVYGLQKALEVILPNNPLLINGEFYVQKKAENLLGDGT